MRHPAPIPHRFPPLAWRRPASVWTPLALVVAIGGPALALEGGGMQQAALVAGAAMFAIALLTLGAAWYFDKAPRTRREVIVHVIAAGFIVALATPFALTQLLGAVSKYEHDGAAQSFTLSDAATMVPLALLLGLPIALLSAVAFALLALQKPVQRDPGGDVAFNRHDVQPFR
ncbi:hypothetical protein [Terricaulis sp.]|uniref:hypothetical protein n=1 Tax=Terricaulis sp. TaxID=2768686 RepID=UPI0037838000